MEKKRNVEKPLKLVAISRGSEFSPNHIGNDELIFCEVVNNLRREGFKSRVVTEKEFVEDRIECDFVYGMVREKNCLERLKLLEEEGVPVVNSAFGIENCIRKEMTEILIANKVPHPKSLIIDVNSDYTHEQFPCWIKRGDSHAMVKQDVVYVNNKAEYDNVLKDFRARGINSAVINEHLQGDIVKFYGVRDTDFFYWFYPSSTSHSKFGLEKYNGDSQGYKFSVAKLKRYSNKASKALDVPIYGGDCIVSEDGTIQIIDFNDWPSFARCRKEAGENIAKYILKRLYKIKNSNDE